MDASHEHTHTHIPKKQTYLRRREHLLHILHARQRQDRRGVLGQRVIEVHQVFRLGPAAPLQAGDERLCGG